MEIGLKCSSNKGLSILRMGLILAFFQAFGKYDFLIQLLIIAVRGLAIISATNLTNMTGIPSGPVDASERNVFRVRKTSPWVTSLSLKADIRSSGRLSISSEK